jgi:hypothetical protein
LLEPRNMGSKTSIFAVPSFFFSKPMIVIEWPYAS